MKRVFSTSIARFFAAPLLALLLSSVPTHSAATDPWEALPQYRFGQSREPLATIEEQIRKADREERSRIEERLLSVLRSPAATQDSRRFVCRWLGLVGTEKSVSALAALLNDHELAHPARIGLEAISAPSAGRALVEALPKVEGNLLLGVISSIGARRVPEAVPALSKLLANADASVVRAALGALGEIGTEQASQALTSVRVSGELARDLARARFSAARRLAEAGKRSEAVAVFRDLLKAAGQPAEVRVASFQGLAGTLPANEAATLIVNALEGEDELLRSAAVKAFAGAGEARASVAARLPLLKPAGQLLLVGILADAPEVPARKPLLQVAQTAVDAAVKAAAIECLAVHGQAEDVAFVANSAGIGNGLVTAAARRTLQRISGPGVNAALLRLVESADGAQRKAVMEALPSRRMSSALPTLHRLASGNDPAVAADAAKTIGAMGSPAEMSGLAKVLTTTASEAVRGAAQEAIRTICTRAEDKAACASMIQSELERAPSAEARMALLPLTVYAGGEAALAEVLKSMRDPNAEVRNVAFRTLVSWPEARAAAPLLRFAETNAQASQSIVALRDGCLRLAEMEEVPVPERVNILRGVTQVAKRPDEKKRAVSLMGQVPSLELLEYLAGLAKDSALRVDAITATVQLARNLGAVYPRQSMAALEQMQKLANTPELHTSIENGMKSVRNAGQSPEGFIIGWMLAGPYTQADTDGSGLFDVAFPPEKNDAEANWRPLTAPRSGMVDLAKPIPGENRVAYLRATINSEADQKALLELGSDDGIKVWLNGQVVHANNAVRPCSPGQDKVNVNLNKGDNTLLLKVTQGGGDFAAVARLRTPDGKPLSNVMVGAGKE